MVSKDFLTYQALSLQTNQQYEFIEHDLQDLSNSDEDELRKAGLNLEEDVLIDQSLEARELGLLG